MRESADEGVLTVVRIQVRPLMAWRESVTATRVLMAHVPFIPFGQGFCVGSMLCWVWPLVGRIESVTSLTLSFRPDCFPSYAVKLTPVLISLISKLDLYVLYIL